MNSPFEYLNTLTQTQYNALSQAQKVTCICDIARQLELPLEPYSRDGVVFYFNDTRQATNPREPFIRLYHNAARTVDNNFELNDCLEEYHKYFDPIEIECGFNRPDERYYERKRTNPIQAIQGVKSIEICQESINVDVNDLASVRKLFNKWSHIIHYDWVGKMYDAVTEGS